MPREVPHGGQVGHWDGKKYGTWSEVLHGQRVVDTLHQPASKHRLGYTKLEGGTRKEERGAMGRAMEVERWANVSK